MSPQEEAIADAAIYVIVNQGFDVVSMRKVAAQAQVAPGTVQYFMGTKEQLLVKALERSVNRQQQRVAQLDVPADLSLVARLSHSLAELLPVGPIQHEDSALWVILGTAATSHPALARSYQRALELFRIYLSKEIATYLSAGQPATEDVVAHQLEHTTTTARLITALVNGISIDNLHAPYSPELAAQIRTDLHEGLRRILGSA